MIVSLAAALHINGHLPPVPLVAEGPDGEAVELEGAAMARRISQFHASCWATVTLNSVVLLASVSIAIAEPVIARRCFIFALPFASFIPFRLWAHTFKCQRRARLLAGRLMVMRTLLVSLSNALTATGQGPVTVYLSSMVVLTLVTADQAFACLDSSHRVIGSCLRLLGCVFGGNRTALGRPVEIVLAVSALLLGELLGSAPFPSSSCLPRARPEPTSVPELQDGRPEGFGDSTGRRRFGWLAERPLVGRSAEEAREFATNQFIKALLPAIYILGASALAECAFAVVEPGYRGHAMVRLPSLGFAAALRAGLHFACRSETQQERGRLWFGRLAVCVVSLNAVVRVATADGSVGTEIFMCSQVVSLVRTAYLGYAALPQEHCVLVAFVTIACALVCPAITETGRPLETVISAAAVLLGAVTGSALRDILWTIFLEQQAQRRDVAAARLALQAAELEHTRREKQIEQDFLAMVCHEVRNPLNGNVGYLRQAATALDQMSGSDPAVLELRSMIDDAVVCGNECLRVLGSMTSLHQLESKLLESELQPVVLADVLSQVATLVRPQIDTGVQLRTVLHESSRGSFATDANVLAQILTNVAQNAARHTSVGFVELCLRAIDSPELDDGATASAGRQDALGSSQAAEQGLNAKESQDAKAVAVVDEPSTQEVMASPEAAPEKPVWVEMRVRDTGSGMSAGTRDRCFDKYSTTGGVGLGLYLTRLQVQALGGRVLTPVSPWSPTASGTEFSVLLPLHRVKEASATPEDARAGRDSPVAAGGGSISQLCFVPNARVLVADDVRINRSLLRQAFTRNFGTGWEVHEASTAEDAQAALPLSHGLDLLVIDEHFGHGMRGSDVIRWLREREAATGENRLAVISCTGNASGAESKLRECGADEVWDKPFPNPTDGSMQQRVAALVPRLLQPAAKDLL